MHGGIEAGESLVNKRLSCVINLIKISLIVINYSLELWALLWWNENGQTFKTNGVLEGEGHDMEKVYSITGV